MPRYHHEELVPRVRQLRERVRPGITGLWQVAGRSTTAFVDRVRFDERYYARLSLLNDLWLCVMTVAR